MGSCGSVHKDPAPAVKVRFSIEPTNRQGLVPTPVNAGNRTVGDVLLKSHSSPSRFVDSGSKDESFFDSQPWLESDCEEDFVSVNGDLTRPFNNLGRNGFKSRLFFARLHKIPEKETNPEHICIYDFISIKKRNRPSRKHK